MEVLQNLDLGVDWIIKVDYLSVAGALIVMYINTIIIGVQHLDANSVYMIILPVICR